MSIKSILRQALAHATLYLPMALMGVLALGSWWLARNTPSLAAPVPQQAQRTEPDYFLTQFSIKSFESGGVLMSEVWGSKGRHFPHTDILEIDEARFRSLRGVRATTGQANRAYSNADGSEVQLVGNAIVVREAGKDASGRALPRVEFRGEFLHALMRTEEIRSHKPVTVLRGADQFSGDSMVYNKLDGIVSLDGRVRVRLESKASPVSQ